ncbi:PAS domain S-box protein [Streptomyces sp. ODS28]|uniref:PAS domain-containing sensor histidine kinase n=1 Tax=Streptomyces sp. ODS28 TaxID=3136688 RepID=UPI0031E9E0C6
MSGQARGSRPDLSAPDLTDSDLPAPDLPAPDLTAPDLTAPDLTAPDLTDSDRARLFQAVDTCTLVHDARTKDILWANPAARSALGFTLDELRPLKAPDMSSPARQYARHIGVAWLQEAVEQGRSRTEWCYRSKSGSDILSEAVAVRVDLDRGPVVMVQFRDIAEEKATRRDLDRTEGRLQAFLRHLDEGIVVLDDDGRVLFAGESAGTLLGRDPEALLGAEFTGFLAPDSASLLRTALARTLRAGPPADERYRLAVPGGAGGAERWFAARCRHIEIDNDLRGLLLLFHDITGTVRAEEQHRRDVQHLNHLARYNAMGDMAMAIAHEVSQPIAAAHNFVAGVLGRLDTAACPEPLSWGLDHAARQLARATSILSSLRAYVGRLEDSKRPVDLNDVVADCAYFVNLRAKELGAEVRWEHTADELPVHCEKVLIGQVVMNLAFNALEEMARWPAERRTVTIATRRSGGSAEAEVRDAGSGPPALPDGRIFDGAFTPRDTGSANESSPVDDSSPADGSSPAVGSSKPGGHGHGIGLALSHRIITRHGGDIQALANSPQGAVFRFRLPLRESLGVPEASPEASGKSPNRSI